MVTCVSGKWMFRVVCGNARRVYLVGDFNHWSKTTIAMDRIGRNVWAVTLELPPGEYQFRYFADDHWLIDYAAFGLAPNGQGDWNSVLYVPPVNGHRTASDELKRDVAAASTDDESAALSESERLDQQWLAEHDLLHRAQAQGSPGRGAGKPRHHPGTPSDASLDVLHMITPTRLPFFAE